MRGLQRISRNLWAGVPGPMYDERLTVVQLGVAYRLSTLFAANKASIECSISKIELPE